MTILESHCMEKSCEGNHQFDSDGDGLSPLEGISDGDCFRIVEKRGQM